jgi:hypothetical protein
MLRNEELGTRTQEQNAQKRGPYITCNIACSIPTAPARSELVLAASYAAQFLCTFALIEEVRQGWCERSELIREFADDAD